MISSEYQILAKQAFRCKGVSDYVCPLMMRTFDRAGYHIVKGSALCPSCYAVAQQAQQVPTVPRGDRIQTRQRIIHFLHSKRWTVGSGDYTLEFKDFWTEFYRWSEEQHLYTKKTLVRSVLAELCGVAHGASHMPISPI
jgi:hypothetical protein